MSALFTSLASIANQYGEAGNSAREEKAARADKLRQLDSQDAYLQLAKQADERAAATQKQALEKGDLLKIGNRLWSVSKAKFVDTQPTDPLVHFKELLKRYPKDVQESATGRVQSIMETDPNDPKAAITEGMRYLDAQQAEANRREDATKREQERRSDSATSEQHRREDFKEHRSELEAFQRSMVPYRLEQTQESKGKELTPAAAKIVETTQPTLQQVDRLLADIDKLKLGNNNQAGYLFGSRLKYALGMASPEGTLADDIAGLSLGSVIEAGSAMQGTSRSLVALKKALVHTPNPWKDSPMLMKRKLTEIRQRLQDMTDDAQKYGTKGAMPGAGGVPAAGPLSDTDVDKALDQAFGAAK